MKKTSHNISSFLSFAKFFSVPFVLLGAYIFIPGLSLKDGVEKGMLGIGILFIAIGGVHWNINDKIHTWQYYVSEWVQGKYIDKDMIKNSSVSLDKWITFLQWSLIIRVPIFAIVIYSISWIILGNRRDADMSSIDREGIIRGITALAIFLQILINWLILGSIRLWGRAVNEIILSEAIFIEIRSKTTKLSWLLSGCHILIFLAVANYINMLITSGDFAFGDILWLSVTVAPLVFASIFVEHIRRFVHTVAKFAKNKS